MNIIYKPAVSTVKPEIMEIGKTTVFLRMGIQKEERTDAAGNTTTFWTYQEAKMSLDEFEKYSKLVTARKSVYDENQMIIMEAIADLYDIVASISGGASS